MNCAVSHYDTDVSQIRESEQDLRFVKVIVSPSHGKIFARTEAGESWWLPSNY